METWLTIVLIGAALGLLCLVAYLIWRFALRRKSNCGDRFVAVTCSTCGTKARVDRYEPPKKIVCSNCSKEGPVTLPESPSHE